MADLAWVIGKCRLWNKCMDCNIMYLHQFSPKDVFFAGNSDAGPLSPKSLKGKGKLKAIVGQQPDIVIDLSVAEEEVYYVVQPDGIIDLTED
ncbi:hypothetical protein EVJ58_g10548 [Rhodofomes roseus]|uniref:Uncharacterized protein n=1 Tax=Rhodofomes roseus TaxID=34475 RepID=A0A4Y9XQ38_9APHY|nr:hypothetical protein EVJ58_g10548 [Rhodofomes roseus]